MSHIDTSAHTHTHTHTRPQCLHISESPPPTHVLLLSLFFMRSHLRVAESRSVSALIPAVSYAYFYRLRLLLGVCLKMRLWS
uniref:Uncharacterized protein n=1 Tax=Anguilla anguilla TaxID=7936 RepID=A0A0E9RE32_ANGAN